MAQSKLKKFNKQQTSLARYAKALAHPARLAILETLAKKNSCICGEIVEVIPLAQSTVSQHLKELKEAGLVTGEIDGPKSCYCLDSQAIVNLEELLSDLLSTLKESFKSKKCC